LPKGLVLEWVNANQQPMKGELKYFLPTVRDIATLSLPFAPAACHQLTTPNTPL
jgi:hypothetical protein